MKTDDMTFVQWLRTGDDVYSVLARKWDDGLTYRQCEALVDDPDCLHERWVAYVMEAVDAA
jgi:hypothetical protein